MSNVEIRKITLDLYDKDEYGQIVDMIEQVLDEVMRDYSKGLHGSIEFTAHNGEEFSHLVTYTINACRGCHGYSYNTINVYCPVGFENRGIQIVANAVNLDDTDRKNVAMELTKKIAAAINQQIEDDGQSETCYLRTIDTLVRRKGGAYTIDSIYTEANAIGITDARLVDMTIDRLLQEKVLARHGQEYMFAKT